MQLPLLTLPRAVPALSKRPTQDSIPPTREERERVRAIAVKYVEREKPVIPLSLEELRIHADKVLAATDFDPKFRDYIAVVIDSEANREALAAVPYERRLLLMPKCLRVEDRCPAPFDEFGLLCKQCGLCTIQDLQNEAERLGYAVLVAEGSALVMAIIQTGKIDAIIGVSCLSVLEKAFPYMEAAAIPGVAIPLLQDDCKDTGIDVEWVWDFIHLTSDDRTYRLDLDAIRDEVETWFSPESLDEILGSGDTVTEQISRAWLAKGGKRWRPFLVACAWRALHDDPLAPFPADVKKLAVAVECFHKASLVHDDIEDADEFRYGEKTLHAEHGVPVALNVGDLLLGDGYRLIAETEAPPAVRSAMVKIAADGHRALCLGQGAELTWANDPRPLSPIEVVDIHRRKTAPAFEVALRLGAAYAEADAGLHKILSAYSEALGIAYQIRDDLEDLTNGDGDDLTAGRPGFLLAVAYERAKDEDRDLLEAAWRRAAGVDPDRVREAVDRLGAVDRSQQMLDSYKEQAVRTLMDVQNPSLKGLLRRVVSKIFSIEIKGWCSEFEARNASGRPAGTEAVG
ncbi:polyprenyl synthetase family protein [Fimbriiglobus ruber]|uniref:Octaprenyl diphosphate synthase n=1 Tax=Fimbriiglobus ruber TaxID=1908690 RepID=A0A225DH99_9BACT|nr:polyprenyl synthetase family protein [Fimbriiglobus ruber]OWK36766.1 Octaprenyl diphosphate synthase [Fimbriiglobus ruber]